MKIAINEMSEVYTYSLKVYHFVAMNSLLSRYHELTESYSRKQIISFLFIFLLRLFLQNPLEVVISAVFTGQSYEYNEV